MTQKNIGLALAVALALQILVEIATIIFVIRAPAGGKPRADLPVFP